MLDTKKFGESLNELGFNFYTWVPCSYLKYFINYAYNDSNYYNAPNEGEALALASGAYVAGMKPVVLLQNSGLGNLISPLTSLNKIFKIPALVFVSLRKDQPGEPQHRIMGLITRDLLDVMGIEHAVLSDNQQAAEFQIQRANIKMERTGEPFFFIVEKNTFDKVELKLDTTHDSTLYSRYEVIEMLKEHDDGNTIYIATTGKTGRELYSYGDKKSNFYMVGSMGLASSFALGVAVNTDKKVVVIDGDGASLMRMGAMPMIAEEAPMNLLHVLLDNSTHDSTGGQDTLSNNVQWEEFAGDLGYSITTLSNIKQWFEIPIFSFLYVQTKPGSIPNLPRPGIEPKDVAKRLKKFIND